MKPGREMDALVAEHVMGWNRWVDWETADYNGPLPMFCPEMAGDHHDVGVAVYLSGGDPEDPCWSPSTDIKAAWEVLEHVVNNTHGTFGEMSWDGTFACVSYMEGDMNCPYREPPETLPGGRYNPDTGHGFFEAMACEKSMPHAICLAALKAVGVEVPE